jgi:ABC-type Fe3+-hydroxamate transport system substrate-binding protein
MTNRHAAQILAAAFTLALITGCASASDEPEAAPSTSANVETSDDACLAVPPNVPTAIAEGEEGTTVTPTGRAAAIDPTGGAALYMVAMEFTVPGVDDPTAGVWAVGSLDDTPGPIMSANAVAAEFTVWPNEINGNHLTAATPGVSEASDCLD